MMNGWKLITTQSADSIEHTTCTSRRPLFAFTPPLQCRPRTRHNAAASLGASWCSSAAHTRSSSAARFSQPNQAHLPTLKMLSDRLGTPPAAAQAAPSALSEMSTNLPAEPTAGRLKLPPSAVARAQISPSPQSGARESKLKGGDTDDRESAKQNGVGSAKENAREIATANAEHKADSSASDNPQATVETNGDGPKATTPPNRGIDERHTDRASLGVGYRAPPPTPQTPLRAAKTAADAEEVPEIVVQTSTPGKGDAAETIEEGEVVEAPVDPNTPLPLAHSWYVA